MDTAYYNNLYKISDNTRRKKYESLLLLSLKSDMSKWSENVTDLRTQYTSPNYGTEFIIEFRTFGSFAFIRHSKPPIKNINNELITDNFSADLSAEIKKLRDTIFTPDIYEIEKSIGIKHSRKEKLEAIDIERVKQIVNETYIEWLENKSEIVAKMIAKIIYAYRKDEEIYKLWTEKFDGELVIKFL